MIYETKNINNDNRSKVVSIISNEWGSSIIVSRGKIHNIEKTSGFAAYDDKNNIIGIIT